MRLLPICLVLLLSGCATSLEDPGQSSGQHGGAAPGAVLSEQPAPDDAADVAAAGSDPNTEGETDRDGSGPGADAPIFTGTDDDSDYPPAAPQDCIAPRRVRSVEHVGNHSILFYQTGNQVWRSRLRRRCAALRRGVVLSYESRAGRLCAGDMIKVLDNFGSELTQVGICVLGEFDYLTEEQAAAFLEYQ